MKGGVILPLILAGFYMKISFDCLRSSSAPAFRASRFRKGAEMQVFLSRGVIAGLSFLMPMAAFSQDYPSRPLRVISPFPPGGGVDFLARILGQKITENWRQQPTYRKEQLHGTSTHTRSR